MLQENNQERSEIDARLLVTAEEDGASRELPIGLPTRDGGELVIGRSRNADLVLQDPYVSGRHLLIRFEQGVHTVKDLGSTHGSTINDRALTGEHRLEAGDRLGFGHCSAVYHRRERKLASAEQLLKPPADEKPQPTPSTQPEDKPAATAAPTGTKPGEPPAKPPAESATSPATQPTGKADDKKPAPPVRRSRSILTTLLGLIVILLVLGVLVVLGLQVFLGIDLVSEFISSEKPL